MDLKKSLIHEDPRVPLAAFITGIAAAFGFAALIGF